MPPSRSDPAKRTWGGTTLDERRTVRRATFIAAALELIGEHGSSAVTVRSLCRRTGLTDRYFYESFDSREELLRALYRQTAEEAHTRMAEAVAATEPDNPEEFARAALETFVQLVVDDPRKGRLLTVEPLADSAYGDVAMETASAFSKLLSSRLPRAGSGTRRAVAVIALTGSLAALLSSWLQGNLTITRDELVNQATEFVVQTFQTAALNAEPEPARKRRAPSSPER
ncbi:TetR/AcrR family transcriptional regulator [Skermania piniformis]|uniref:TetR/AcrR family transcriptional regulator n=1 Tax=Skermania pinensis TaxID=39122 RepID=A0ABX8SBR2_9ACTN|nr:TetR/AcrR family transcriptional regulator [Skermania piniformis]QXQ14417.1 TetR/AcrR family transcriptional regulator [Skermania piniformis]